MVKLLICAIFASCIAISAICKAVQDFIAHRGGWLRRGAYWTAEGWKLKYKNGDPALGERFWGSSRWFVFLTDAWHLFDLLRDLFKMIGFGVVVTYFSCEVGISPLMPLLVLVISQIGGMIAFEATYSRFKNNGT